jgi:adenylate kinase family enzyme
MQPNLAPRRIHFTGGAGSGKTHLAARLASDLGIPHYDLDGLALQRFGEAENPDEFPALIARLTEEVKAIAAGETWITDGAYVTWLGPLFESADLIVWLDMPWRLAAYRIVARHVKAEVARNNRFPGWRRMLRFWLFSRRYYANTNPDGPNEYGNPRTKRTLAGSLEAYRDRLTILRGKAELEAFVRDLPR